MGTDFVRSVETNVVALYGSFRGFTTASANYDARQTRGNYFTVSWVSTGRYRVTLTGAVPLLNYSSAWPTQTPGTTATPGWPAGLVVNPTAFLTCETQPTQLPQFYSNGTVVTSFYNVYCTPFSATTNSFDILTNATTSGAGILTGPADVTANDRVNFQLSFKLSGYTP
jgi:hypothetical protein